MIIMGKRIGRSKQEYNLRHGCGQVHIVKYEILYWLLGAVRFDRQ